jgi:uncharacterized membrane protein YvlD (DUF360 family)
MKSTRARSRLDGSVPLLLLLLLLDLAGLVLVVAAEAPCCDLGRVVAPLLLLLLVPVTFLALRLHSVIVNAHSSLMNSSITTAATM